MASIGVKWRPETSAKQAENEADASRDLFVIDLVDAERQLSGPEPIVVICLMKTLRTSTR